MKSALRLGLLLGGLLIGGAAFAQTVTYTFSGNIDGSVGGVAFAGQNFTFTVTGQLAAVQNAAYPYTNQLTSGTITIAGTACAAGCTMSTPGTYAVYALDPGSANVHGISDIANINGAGFTLLEACYSILSCPAGGDVADNLASIVAPTTSGDGNALAPYVGFATSGGVVAIDFVNGAALTYGVGVGAAAVAEAVPTLSQWSLMMLAGLIGMFGFWRLGARPL